MNQLIRRLGDASARRPYRTLAAWGLLVALVVALSGAFGGAFTDDFTAPGSESAEAMTLLQQRFPEVAVGSAYAVFATSDGQPLSRFRAPISSALSGISGTDRVAAVGAPVFSADGRIGYAQITLAGSSAGFGAARTAALVEALAPARASGLTAELGGEAAFVNAEQESGAEAVGLLAALVVLVVVFGTVVAALVPIALALVAVGTGLGAIVLLASALDVSTAAPTIGAMVGLGVGIDYALLIVSRYRDHRADGQAGAEALSSAMATAGTAVLFAGLTVVVAMAALVLTGVGLLASIGLGTALVVLLAVAAALTLLPALLSLLGDRIDAGRLLGRRRRRPGTPVEATVWWRLAHLISARPWPYLVAGSVLLLTLAAPALSLRTGFPDSGDSVRGATEREAFDLLANGFGPGFNAPLLVVADLRAPGLGAGDLPALAVQLAADPGVVSVGQPQVAGNGSAAVLSVQPAGEPGDPATARTLGRIRATSPARVLVTGQTALTLDLDEQLRDTLPLFVGAILLASVLLLMVVFRSVTVPLKAAVMNLLSIGGAYGVVVVVFQWGWLGAVFGLDRTYLIASPLPAIFFAVLFGLSMDYEVFLVSRIREAYVATGDNAGSVARGLAATGRVITSGALIMMAVFLSFVANPSPFVKMIGLGLATAIALDATVVRLVLVPATMALLGRANWWLPGWLDRLLPHVVVAAAPGATTGLPERARSAA